MLQRFLLTISMCIVLLISFNGSFVYAQSDDNILRIENSTIVKAQVIEIKDLKEKLGKRLEDEQGFKILSIQQIKLKILEGKYKGKDFIVENSVSENPNNLQLNLGDKVLVQLNEYNNGNLEIILKDIYRINYLLFFLLMLILIVFIFLGIYSWKIIVIGSLVIWFFMFKFLQFKEFNSNFYLYLIFSLMLIILLISLIKYKFTKLAISFLSSSFLGILSSFLFSWWFNNVISSTKGRAFYLNNFFKYNFNIEVIFTLLLNFAVVGFCLIVANRVVNRVYNTVKEFPNIRFNELVVFIFNRNKDKLFYEIISFIFVFLSLSLYFIFMIYRENTDWTIFINHFIILYFVVQFISGVISIFLTSFITMFISSILFLNRKIDRPKAFRQQEKLF